MTVEIRIVKDSNTYEEFWPVLWGCNFFKNNREAFASQIYYKGGTKC